MRTVLMLVLGAFLCGVLAAGESVTDTRRQIQEALNSVSSSMFTERIKGLRMLTMALESQLLGELQAVDKVMEISKKNTENPNVRIEAINTLVVFKTNGIEVPKLLELLGDVIKDEKSNTRVRNMALLQLPNIAPMQKKGETSTPERERVMETLKALYDSSKRKPLPVSTYQALVTALGNFADKEATMKILREIAANEKRPEVRSAALRAVRNSIGVAGKADRKMAEAFENWLAKATDPANVEVRVLLLECLENIVAQIPATAKATFKPRDTTRKIADKMLAEGGDAEAIAAVKFLMRVSGQDVSIVKSLLKAATPQAGRKQPLSFKALELINAGLVNVLYTIGKDKKNASAAEEIITHMLSMLNPNAQGVPEEIKETMIMGLGIIPETFSREKAVQCLIELLKIESAKEAPVPGRIRQLEDALTSLTDAVPFHTVTYEQVDGGDNTVRMQKKVAPDIAAWNDWVAKNKKNLQPKK